MLKKQAVFLLIAAMTIGGCFGTNTNSSGDKGSGVVLLREDARIRVIAEDEIAGGSFVIDKAIESDSILVEADKMKIVKVVNGKTYVSIVDVDAPSVEGDKLFEIKNCSEKVTVELSESVNEGNFEKTMKKAYKNAEKKGCRATTTEKLLGDFNNSGTVDITDFLAFKANYNSTTALYDIAPAEMGTKDYYSICTPDGSVGLLDFLVFGRNYGKGIGLTVTGITLSGATTVEAGSTIDITATVLYSNGEKKSEVVEWSTSDETVATQTANGEWTRVTGVKVGTVTIKASKNGKVGELTVTVTPTGNKIDSIEITGGNGVGIGSTLQLTATSTLPSGAAETTGATWTSSNTAVATVDSTGKVTGVSAGKTKIKAVRAGVSHEITVVVATVPNGVKVHAKGYKTVYAWEGSNTVLAGAWPGTALSTTGESTGWGSYYFEGKDGISIIFIDASGNKTGDLTGIKKGEHWYLDGKWYDYNPDEDFIAPELTATPEAGNQEGSSVDVVLTAKDNIDTAPKIYYTLDGTMPTTSSTVFSSKITLTKDAVVKAITVDSSSNVSKVYVLSYKLNQDVTLPELTATPAPARYDNAQSVKLTAKDNKDTNPTIYYTIDGSTPKAELTYMYNGQTINVSKSMIIKTLTVDKSGNQLSKSLSYTIGAIVEVDRKDFREETIYFALTARFYDGDPSNNSYCRADDTSGNRKNNDPPFRGDFKGLIQKLDYIKAMGFTAIWVTPPILNRSDYDFHGYHGWDFTKVDPRLESAGGTYQDFINAAHSKGIKVIQDIVLNHSSKYGEKNLQRRIMWGDDSDPDWGAKSKGGKGDYYDVYNPNFEYDGLTKEPNSGKAWYNGDCYQKEKPTIEKDLPWLNGDRKYMDQYKHIKGKSIPNDLVPNLASWGAKTQWRSPEGYAIYTFQWSENAYSLLNPAYYHVTNLGNWEEYDCQIGVMHPDCLDFNTESKPVQDYLINAYNKYIDMGVDAFRIDTVKHISRNTFNRRFLPAFKAKGGEEFYMFGEVCTRVNEVWNKGNAPLSAPFYTWKERKEYSADDEVAAWESYEYELAQGTGGQPTSDNHLLKGNEYHKPDYSKNSGMGVIDFPMHWNFKDAGSAYNLKSEDKYYNDATWNVTYVESHDYSPWEAPGNASYRAPIDESVWAEDLALLWTFRGIPCLYYGDEIQDAKGNVIDAGPTKPLAETGRPYFGNHIEGNVTATDFGVWSGATGELATTLNHPLAKHIQRLNRIRLAVPALQKGQYSTEGITGSGVASFKRRFVNSAEGIDSYALVTISGDATFTGVLNGTYTDVVTGDKKVVSNGTLTASCSGKGNMRVYVLNGPGKIGEAGTYLK